MAKREYGGTSVKRTCSSRGPRFLAPRWQEAHKLPVNSNYRGSDDGLTLGFIRHTRDTHTYIQTLLTETFFFSFFVVVVFRDMVSV